MHNKSVARGAGWAILRAFRRPALASLAILSIGLGGSAVLRATPLAEAQEPPAATAAATTADIVSMKTHVANLYDGYLKGEVRYADLSRAEAQLSAMTGEQLRGPVFGTKRRLEEHYAPFRQLTDYWCGPATVQSILWFLGVRDEAAVNNPTAARGMTGRPDVDQRLLTAHYLGTEAAGGTSWGELVPGTINKWRGTSWYQAFATPLLGGTLDKEQAWRDIQYAIDHGYPVAANVLLGPGTVTPTGFSTGINYQHWETIVGYFEREGVKYVKVGQVYGESDYDPLQEIPWDTYWPAVGNWYGIVW